MPGGNDQEALAASVDWLMEATAKSGISQLPQRLSTAERHDVQSVLERVRAEIAPFELPSDIEWFWETWNPTTFELVLGHPRLTDPAFALDSWHQEGWPRPLMPIAYESHCFLGVEMIYAGSPGPRLYDYCFADDGFTVRAPNLATLISANAAAHETVESGPAYYTSEDVEFVDERCQEAIDVQGIPLGERGPFFDDGDLLNQPERWRLAQGINESTLALRGATHTIADVIEACRHGNVTATVVGWARARGGSGEGRLDTVEDDTGSIEVWVPVSVPMFGPPSRGRREYDIVARRNGGTGPTVDDFRGHHAEAVRLALSGDLDGAARVGAEFGYYLHGDHPIVAVAVRPVL